MLAKLEELKNALDGDLFTDLTMRTLYATDASVYREMPLAVAMPKTKADIQRLIGFANKHKTSLIPRAAGTSLAGQVVGKGIVVDISLYWDKIIEVNQEERWVRVQPAVNLDELNKHLAAYNLFFGPETSTSNRCMIGGMVGNNSCGSHSILYGSTRDHVLELTTFLSDGSEVVFKELTNQEFIGKCKGNELENSLYQHINKILSKPDVQQEIREEFPKPSIRRRNTGYAIDELLETAVFTEGKENFNMCKLLSGSEGTLAFTTEIKLNLVPAPPKTEGVVAVHLNTIEEAALATIIARKYAPGAVELLDDIVIKCAKQNAEQLKNLFFIQGEPKAVVVVEWARDTKEAVEELADALIAELKSVQLGYHFPKVWGSDIKKIWTLRKAGLGLLANVPGDPKAVACIEDTAVDVNDLPQFILEFQDLLTKYNQTSVFYAHIGDGELHLRPILDLKIEKDRKMFHTITDEVATLVKKFKGSLSGEHGDGRVRGEFIRKMIGENNYQLICDLKKAWDPNDIFNPNKIVHTPKMNESLRYENNQQTNQFKTVFNFSETGGILRMAEKCNGSGDCRKSAVIGGTMCPSYMATKSEKETTRARANILREFLTRSTKLNKFDHQEIKEVFDLCISCKGCQSECPSNVDVAMMKAEFLHQYYLSNGVPFRTKMIGNFDLNMTIASYLPRIYNFLMSNGLTSPIAKKIMGIAPKRNFPLVYKTTLKAWAKKHLVDIQPSKEKTIREVFVFCDEYTNFNDTEIGIKTLKLLTALGYHVTIPTHSESGRTFLSKGLLEDAKKVAKKNVQLLHTLVTKEKPLLGIEPSAILSFRDEYPKLVDEHELASANSLAKHCFMIDEFIANEAEAGRINAAQFTQEAKTIKLHGHCHQKVLSSVEFSKKMLSLPSNYSVEVIPSGCCGMAGSFGYEKEHYDVSMNIGELVLFPAIRKTDDATIIAAPGTSCRHQIHDGTQRSAKHTVEVLFEALAK